MLTAAIAAARITFATFAMISFSASGETRRCFWEDWITLPQIPSRFLESCIACEARRIAVNIAKLPEHD